MNKKTAKNITIGAIIAALYTALSLIIAPLSFGAVQLRISEALTVLPAVYPPSIVGLTLGCFLSNLLGFFLGANPLGFIDAIVGSSATLLAALLTAYIGKKFKGTLLYLLAPLPPVLFNALFVGAELCIIVIPEVNAATFFLTCLYIAIGEAIACYLGGSILLKSCSKFLLGVYEK